MVLPEQSGAGPSRQPSSLVQNTERTPLLSSASEDAHGSHDGYEGRQRLTDEEIGAYERRPTSSWVAIIAAVLFLLGIIAAIITLLIKLPPVADRYAHEAMTYSFYNASVLNFTDEGIWMQARGSVGLDASRVDDKFIRRVGRWGTGIVRKVHLSEFSMEVTLPDYDGFSLGIADVPAMTVDIRDGHENDIDVITLVKPADNLDKLMPLLHDYMDGKLSRITVKADSSAKAKAGWFPIGTRKVSERMTFDNLPTFSNPDISNILLSDPADDTNGIEVSADAHMRNPSPVGLTVPSLDWQILLPRCSPEELVELSKTTTPSIPIVPEKDVELHLSAHVPRLDPALTAVCDGRNTSSMDDFLLTYLAGNATTVYIRGVPSSNTPAWMSRVLESLTLPVPFPGHKAENMIKNFQMSNVKLSIAAGIPLVSAVIEVTVGLPSEMQLGVNVTKVRASMVDLYDGPDKFGRLEMKDFAPAISRRDDEGDVVVKTDISNVPFEVTDGVVFRGIMRSVIFGGKDVVIGMQGSVDAGIESGMGDFVVRNLPAVGEIGMNGLPMSEFEPKFEGMKLMGTTHSSITFGADARMNNTTPYGGVIPYMNVHLIYNGSVIGDATVRDLKVRAGEPFVAHGQAVFDPGHYGGKTAKEAGAKFISAYVSKENLTMTLRTHRESIPSSPNLSEAMAGLEFSMPVPEMFPPADGEEGHDREFMRDATFHVLSSSANFILHDPFPETRLIIYDIEGNATHDGTFLGRLAYDQPFTLYPGDTETPKFPVYWDPSGVGKDIVKKALGGNLKIDAVAKCLVSVGTMKPIWVGYNATGIGARVRI
ncbi:hypothetical protein SAICODRAFT_71330 [Saitoella complicata NRRL Y-17804]|nr:uncharacterized protein SAICODRAFT_71330 [Saitoella complicata NRRL Y-17804]ODQ52900.1 hypothetical protein SAICODRAFT_71330 [Saitoella complicata NRRL Y-17804]